MWKLTIIQQKQFLNSDSTYEVEVEFLNEDIHELLLLVDKLSNIEGVRETSYRIEKAKESEA